MHKRCVVAWVSALMAVAVCSLGGCPSEDAALVAADSSDGGGDALVGVRASLLVEPAVGHSPLEVAFDLDINADTPPFTLYFGDGGSTTTLPAVHEYSEPGVYQASLEFAGTYSQLGAVGAEVHVVPPMGIAAEELSGMQFAFSPVVDHELNLLFGAYELQWEFGDGSQETGMNPQHSYSAAGYYTVTLSILIAGTQVQCASQQVRAVAPQPLVVSAAPIARAGADQTVTSGEVVLLDGASSSGGGNYNWDQIFGLPVELSDPNSPQTSFVAPAVDDATDLVFRLSLSGGGGTSTDLVNVVVEPDDNPTSSNEKPHADAGEDRRVVDASGTGSVVVELDASGSSDPDGSIVSYKWYADDVLIWSGTTRTAQVTLGVGARELMLQVTDDDGEANFDFVTITVDPQPAQLGVTPTALQWVIGDAGGPFSPGSVDYTVFNAGVESLSWTAAVDVDWVTLSLTAGALGEDASKTVTATINGNANSLTVGSHDATLTFQNADDESQLITRTIRLAAGDPPEPAVLGVTPSSEQNSSGTAGGPFSPSGFDYTLENTGELTLNWTASVNVNWVTLSVTSGALEEGADATVTASLNANANGLGAGAHTATLTFRNADDGSQDLTRTIRLSAADPADPAELAVTPATGFTSSGPEGGVFLPETASYIVKNTGDETMSWSVSSSQNWVTAAPASGSLDANESTTVVVSLDNVNARALSANTYGATISFSNNTNGDGNTSRSVNLTVTPPGASEMSAATRTSGVMPLGVFFDVVNDSDEGWSSQVVQPRGFEADPSNITGVRITRVEFGTPIGAGTLSYNASAQTLTWAAQGESAGSAVDVSGGKEFAVPSSGGEHLHVWVKPSALPGGNQSDAITIVDGGLNADWASFHYEWNFGDAGAGNWATGRQNVDGSYPSKNETTGFVAAHVYESAGLYTVTLTVTDDVGGTHEYTQDVEVLSEPAGGWITYYVSSSDPNASDSNLGTDPAAPLATAGAGFSKLGPDVRVLFKRGDTWTITDKLSKSPSGPALIGAYGTGPEPSIECDPSMGTQYALYIGGTDVRVCDLSIVGTYPTDGTGNAALQLGSSVANMLVSRIAISNTGASGFNGGNFGNGTIFYECRSTQSRSTGHYAEKATRFAVIGCDYNANDTSHCIYTHNIQKGVFAHNQLVDGDHTGLVLAGASTDTFGPTKFIVVSDNYMADSNYAVESSCHNSTYFEMWHCVIERNRLMASSESVRLAAGVQRTTVRNNECESMVQVLVGNNLGASPHPASVYVFNNTIYTNAAYYAVRFEEDLTSHADLRFENNLVRHFATNGALPAIFDAFDVVNREVRIASNCYYAPDTGRFAFIDGTAVDWAAWLLSGYDESSMNADPLFEDAGSDDFRLRSGSPAINAGSARPHIRDDFYRNVRDSGSIDLGAHER